MNAAIVDKNQVLSTITHNLSFTFLLCREQREEMESDMCNSLPEDVVVRILACLPTMIVVRLRLVCKRWNQLISSPNNFPLDVPLSCTPAFLLACSDSLKPQTNFLVFGGSPDCLPTSHLSTLSTHFLPRASPSNPIKVVAACKGLLCCSFQRQPTLFYICNPSTGTYVRLPPPNQLTKWDFIALAFHSSTRRCSLAIGRKYTTQQRSHSALVEMYDSLAHSWTQLQMPTRPSVNPQGEGIYSNGRFHWINETHNSVLGRKYDVVAFSVERRRWDLIPHPQHTQKEILQFWKLGGQDGNVVLIYKNDLSFWKLIEDADDDFDARRCRWSPLPGCLFDLTDDDNSLHTGLQVAVNCSGWILVYLPTKRMVVFDADGRSVCKMEGKQLSSWAKSGARPSSVRGFEADNMWWPS